MHTETFSFPGRESAIKCQENLQVKKYTAYWQSQSTRLLLMHQFREEEKKTFHNRTIKKNIEQLFHLKMIMVQDQVKPTSYLFFENVVCFLNYFSAYRFSYLLFYPHFLFRIFFLFKIIVRYSLNTTAVPTTIITFLDLKSKIK